MHDDARLKQLYGDLFAAGSLAAALQDALESNGSLLRVQQPLGRWYGTVELEDRHSQIMIGAEHRAFSSDFWHRGILYGHIWCSDIRLIAAIIGRFLEERATIDALTAAFPAFIASEAGRAHEAGRFVEHTWEHLLANATRHPHSSLVTLIQIASEMPALRQLLPYTSHEYLCFSRTMGFPYSSDCPHVAPAPGGWFRVYAPNGNERLLFEGSAEDALLTVVANLPAGCGPAMDGTRADLPH